MASLKPIPFIRVRVLASDESGWHRRPGEQRAATGVRAGSPLQWIRHGKFSAVPPRATPALPEPDLACLPDTIEPVTPHRKSHPPHLVDMAEVEPEPSAVPQEPQEPEEQDVPDMPVGPHQRPQRRPEGAVEELVRALPIAAIARSVRDASAMRSVMELVLDTCSGEGKRETGPWDLSMSLQEHGLGRSTLCLHLSRELLSLRFQCDGVPVQDLISRYADTLQSQLEEHLQLPLKIDIALTDD
jgi:hypothetical protein